MANQVTVQRTTFIDHPDNEKSFGYRFDDDHASGYQNFETESIFELDDLAFLAQIRKEAPPALAEMFSFLVEFEKGITIDGNFHEYDEIKGILTGTEAGRAATGS